MLHTFGKKLLRYSDETLNIADIIYPRLRTKQPCLLLFNYLTSRPRSFVFGNFIPPKMRSTMSFLQTYSRWDRVLPYATSSYASIFFDEKGRSFSHISPRCSHGCFGCPFLSLGLKFLTVISLSDKNVGATSMISILIWVSRMDSFQS